MKSKLKLVGWWPWTERLAIWWLWMCTSYWSLSLAGHLTDLSHPSKADEACIWACVIALTEMCTCQQVHVAGAIAYNTALGSAHEKWIVLGLWYHWRLLSVSSTHTLDRIMFCMDCIVESTIWAKPSCMPLFGCMTQPKWKRNTVFSLIPRCLKKK